MFGWRRRLLIISALLSVCAGIAHNSNDDFGFEIGETDDLIVELAQPPPAPLKLKGIPDVQAQIGKLLQFAIPEDSFKGNIVRLEVTSTLPNWLKFNPITRTFTGIPLATDKSDFLVSIIAYGSQESETVRDVFRINIHKQSTKLYKSTCNKKPLVLTIYMEQNLDDVKPQQRSTAITNLAGFLGLNSSAFTLGAQKLYTDTIVDGSVILAGPGNVKNHVSSQPITTIDMTVGCNGKLWDKYISLINQLKEQTLDGTISEVIGWPVFAWHVNLKKSEILERGRRQAYDADQYDDYDLEYEYEDDDDGEVTTIQPSVENHTTVPLTVVTSVTATETETERSTTIHDSTEIHPHRHHHGEIPKISPDFPPRTHFTNPDDITSRVTSSMTTTPSSTTTQAINEPKYPAYSNGDGDNEYDDDDDDDEEITELPSEITEPPVIQSTKKSMTQSQTTIQELHPVATTLEETSTSDKATTVQVFNYNDNEEETIYDEFTTIEESTTSTSVKLPTVVMTETTEQLTTTSTTSQPPPPPPPTTTTTTTQSTTPTTTTVVITTTEPTTTEITTPLTTITPTMAATVPTTTIKRTNPTIRTTDSIEYGIRNLPPQINHRLKKIHITAGTVLSYIIPEDTFQDFEDGSQLQLKFIDQSADKNNWIQFNEHTKEIYGLPLEEHVSKYNFLIRATDKDGASVSDNLEVVVQQHKGSRTVTHEFKLNLRVEKKDEFRSAVDWQLRTLRGLAQLFNNKDLSQIVVRNIEFSGDQVTFSWTNDTLPKSYCPKNELDYLLSIMKANTKGDPSYALSQVLSPELRVQSVEYKGIGQCEEKSELPVPPPKVTSNNFSPIPRNQVDHINATAGELLVFKVPVDTFYDPEDGDARNLKMTLLTMDRRPIRDDYWLQFDIKNQEFYGIPLQSDIGRSEFQLVCEDRGGLTANDAIVVTVNPAPRIRYNVEFSMTLDMDYVMFMRSSSLKRKFVEKLQELFRDKNKNNIQISSIVEGSTIVTWNNKSLPTDRCQNTEIRRLRRVLVNDDETLADRVELIMAPDFPVSSISLTPIGICQGEQTPVHIPDNYPPPDESQPAESSDEYLITFVVPAVIIAFMLILAGVVACVLYRRRRTGKMNVEDDERQSFRNKGIPVIFQDEIDEKPDPATKAPVILKEEKPPLPPPEYSKGGTPVQHDDNEDAPYQPPPPFTPSGQDNGRMPRPKPTPTYRKPPPYVPP